MERREEELLAELLRQGGLTARAVIGGSAGLAAAFANPVALGLNKLNEAMDSDLRFPEQYGAIQALLTEAGLPEPANKLEKIAGFVGEFGVPDPSDAPKVLAGISHLIDPNLAHLIPIQAAIAELRKVDPEHAEQLSARSDRARELLEQDADPDVVARETTLQAVPIGNEMQLFYRPDRNRMRSLANMDEIRALAAQPNAGYQLHEIYDNPALFEVVPELRNMPVLMMHEQRSAPIAGLISPAGIKGGSFDPQHKAIELPVYPPFEQSELTPEVLLQAFALHPEALLGGPDELIRALTRIEGEFARDVGHSIVHETEHANQQLHNLPRGSNPYEAGVMADADPNPITRPGTNEQFTIPDPSMQRMQQGFAMADYSSYGGDLNTNFTAFNQTLQEQMESVRQETDAALQQVSNEPAMQQRFAAIRDAILQGFQRVKEDLEVETADLDRTAQQMDIPPDELPQVLSEAFQEVKRRVIQRNINRLSDIPDVYRRFWGEAGAEAAAYHYANGADFPSVAGAMTEIGKVYRPAMLIERPYRSSYEPIPDAQFRAEVMQAEEINPASVLRQAQVQVRQREAKARLQRAEQLGFNVEGYHGSTHDIRRFSTHAAEPGSDWGRATYISTSPEDASANYAGVGPDLSARISLRSEQLADELYNTPEADFEDTWGIPYADYLEDEAGVAHELARNELKGQNEGTVYPLRVRENDLIHVGGDKDTFLPLSERNYYDEARADLDPNDYADEDEFQDAVMDYVQELQADDSDNLIAKIYDALVQSDLYNDTDAIVRIMEEVTQDASDGDGLFASRLNHLIRREASNAMLLDDDGNMISGGAIAAQVFENLGFKGAVDSTVYEKFGRRRGAFGAPYPGMPGVDPETQHIVVFPGHENIIRSRFAKFDPDQLSSTDILAGVGAAAITPAILANALRDEEEKWKKTQQ